LTLYEKTLLENLVLEGEITKTVKFPILHLITVFIGTLSRTVRLPRRKTIAYLKERIEKC